MTVLRDGQYIGTKAVADTNERELISMMVGRTIDELFPKQEARVGEVVFEHDALSETEVEAAMVAAQVGPEHKRPSVETFLHALCLSHEGVTWVGHTHVLVVNQILCSALGAEPFKQHIFPDAIVVCGRAPAVVPYADLGFGLAKAVHAELTRYRKTYSVGPKLLLLES